MKTTRRQMIWNSLRYTAAAAAITQAAPLFAAAASRRFKIGACEWNLGKLQPACFDTAKEIGLDGVQVTMGGIDSGLNMRQAPVREAYLAASRRTGVAIASLALAETNEVPLFSEPRGAVWLLDSLDVCRALGLRVILVALFSKGELRASDKPAVDNLVGLLKEVAPRAEKAGVILGLENYCSAKENLDLLQRVGSPAVQVYYDVGNSTDKGYDIYQEIRMLGKNICEFHAKDGPHMLGQGRIDFKKVRAAMDEIEYSGWIQIEAAAPHGLIPDYKAHLATLREAFPAT
jgi:L-ribulose-5-phosphate 3-epimerase